jgi:hypothetical protein
LHILRGQVHGQDDDAKLISRLDNVRLAVLADALEEAGCDSIPLLMHLRGRERLCHPSACADPYGTLRGHHVRGCWALDLMVTAVMKNQGRSS